MSYYSRTILLLASVTSLCLASPEASADKGSGDPIETMPHSWGSFRSAAEGTVGAPVSAMAYDELPVSRSSDRPAVQRCGLVRFVLEQEKQGKSWTKGRLFGGYSTVMLEELKPCRAPKAVVKGYKKETKQAIKILKDFKKGEAWSKSSKVTPNRGWQTKKHPITGKDVSRSISFDHFSKTHSQQLGPCLEANDVLCEEGGSKAAKALNQTRHYLKLAREFEKAGKQNSCAVAAHAARFSADYAITMREHGVRAGNWKSDAQYKTRWDGRLDDTAAFKLIGERHGEAKELFLSCGGDESSLDR